MKKTFLIFELIIIFAIGFTSFALSQTAIPSGTARFEALGYNPFIMDAAIDLNRNPAWGNKYNNYSFGDIGRFTTDGYGGNSNKDSTYRLREQYLAVNFRVGKQWSLGLLLNKEEGQIFTGDIRSYYQSIGNRAPLVPFKALIAYNSSANITLGLAPYVAYWSSDFTSTNLSVDRSTSIWGGTFGLLAKSSATSWSEGTVGVLFNTYKVDSVNNSTTTKYENDGGLELRATYRGWYRMKNSTVNLVPYINFGIMNWEPTRTPVLSETLKSDFWNIIGGVGINVPITDNGMLAGGVSGGYISNSFTFTDTLEGDGIGTIVTEEVKFEDIIFPQFNIGIEWNLTDWMQGRFGYARSLSKQKAEFTSTDTISTSSEFNESFASNPDQTINLGIGMQFGSFSLDGVIGERFIQIGPNVFSGKENDLYGVLSMSYNFKK